MRRFWSDVVGYSRPARADEDRTLARLRGLRSDLIDPAIAAHRGRTVKRTGDGSIIEFRSAVDAVRCAIEVRSGMVERNAGAPPEGQEQGPRIVRKRVMLAQTKGGLRIVDRLEGRRRRLLNSGAVNRMRIHSCAKFTTASIKASARPGSRKADPASVDISRLFV